MKLNLESYEMEHDKKVKPKGKLINRDISWVAFNARVLYYAQVKNVPMEKHIPINERFKFLAISDSNLNEFLSVRYPYVKKHKDTQPFDKLQKEVKKFIDTQSRVYNELKLRLKDIGMEIVKPSKLDNKELRKLKSIFMNDIFPLITPIQIGSVNEYVKLDNGQLCIAVLIDDGTENLNIIPVSKAIKRMYIFDKKVVLIEDVIYHFLNDIFTNKAIISKTSFKIIKDSDIELSHDTSRYIVERMQETILSRKLSKSVYMIFQKGVKSSLKKMLSHAFKVSSKNTAEAELIDYTRFFDKLLSDKKYSYKPFKPHEFQDDEVRYSLFEVLNEKDILLHHPYDSYDTVVKFIYHAAIDPDVLAIKQTLYRVSSIDSPIVNALCTAANNGKHVAVLVEIKARFDEENNIALIKKLKESGVVVLLGLEHLKTHCKMCVVVRQEGDKKKIYSHIGTGNYNEKTAKQYTDLSYLTSKSKIGIDLLNVFNIIAGNSSPKEKMQKIAYSPVTLRKTLIKCIDREISIAKSGKDAEIFIKVNSLSDTIMVNKLYDAAKEGVKITIICRGVCSICPRENIRIKSIVGRFLEHSRIYYFRNNKNSEYFISSADLLTRNLDKRVETLVSVKDSNVVKKLESIMNVLIDDTENSFTMTENGSWVVPTKGFNSHEWLIENSKPFKKN